VKNVERVILQNLIYNEEFSRRVTPFLKSEYFHDPVERMVFSSIQEFIMKYNALPTKEAIVIDLNKNTNINEEQFKHLGQLMEDLSSENVPELLWLINETEDFCKDKAIYNVMLFQKYSLMHSQFLLMSILDMIILKMQMKDMNFIID